MTYRPYGFIGSDGSSIEYSLSNSSGNPIVELTPVTTNAVGGIKPVNVSSETDALNVVGVTKESILNNTEGSVVAVGRILNVSLPFPLNSTIWIAKDGSLTNQTPEEGLNGFVALDFVIRVGKIVKNQTNPLNKDFIVNMELIGQL